jgi:hypothetical protein
MCKSFSFGVCVPSMEALFSRACLNYTASADSISFSDKYFRDFRRMEKEVYTFFQSRHGSSQ